MSGEPLRCIYMNDQDETIDLGTSDQPQPNPFPRPDSQTPRSSFGIPQAIFSGLAIIAVSIYISFGIPNYKAASRPLGSPSPVPSGAGKVAGETVAVSPDDDPVAGSADAKVTIIEFSDFQCPFCRKFWGETLPLIKKNYLDKGLVKFVYRDFPLTAIHPMAQTAAEAAECADEQGRFWDMHDKIFSEQDKLGEGTVSFALVDLKDWAAEVGLDGEKFNSCLISGKYKDEVLKDLADGTAAGVTGTPTMYIDGKQVAGAQPYETFRLAIDEALKK